MKKLKGFLLILLILSLILSCNNDSVTWGKIEVTLSNEVSRGIAPTDMSTDNYDVVILNAANETIASTNIKVSDTSVPLTFSVPSGTYTISVEAKNKDNEVIGMGESTATVTPNSTTNCQIAVQEISGNGTLSVQIDSDTPNTPVLKIYKADLSLLDTVTATESDGKFVASKSLPNGFYYFEILDDDKVIDSETVRIVANKTVAYSVEYSVYGDGSITIIDSISPTPSISFEISSNISSNSLQTITPTITGFIPTTFSWYLDGSKIAETKDLSFEASDYILGEHTLTLIASNETIVWSEKKNFSIYENPLADHYVAYAPRDSKVYYFFDFIDDSLYFSDTLNRHYDVGPLSYDIIPAAEGKYLVFNPYGYKTEALFIPTEASEYELNAKIYYDCTLNEESELTFEENDYQSVNLIIKDSPVSYEESIAQYDETSHVKTRVTEYGTFLTWERINHTFDENDVCIECGFNQNEYLLSNNIEKVTDNGMLFISRYWPGITTLGDGTLIENENSFYIKKEPRYDNYYTIYYPSSIYDTYEEGGGTGSSDEAFLWYLKEYYGLDYTSHTGYFDSGLKTSVEKLWADGVKEASPDDYSDPSFSRTVYTDTSLITDEMKFGGLGSYNLNTNQNEDGTHITDCKRFYFYITTYEDGDTYFNISYPQSLQDEYEKAQLFNSNSGNPLWRYLSTYYPDDPRTNDEETKALMIKLLESEFIEPNYEDYI